ncbi:aldehyde dehydrogenase [Cellulophaga algicola DSM 14237]|uniref:Aldehyde dehydrogenase n=1 Tax=Cellulophaga algicola (strain DSM 14237 / IC166 / ACAM 630) TaxID=688270 RepID=E6X9J1_CELAD|nr:hypothetical protein [Cellulophaga algicola]ADV48741.1 aldehyde dehydrogenase [Cellulophaga algicola DSM 14237]
MSYDLVLWKRSSRTKTAMLKECFESIMEEKDHTAMEFFDEKTFFTDMETEFGTQQAQYFGEEIDNCPFLYETGKGDYGNWILFNLVWSDYQDTTSNIVAIAVKNGIMVYDPQRESVYGNRRPKKD